MKKIFVLVLLVCFFLVIASAGISAKSINYSVTVADSVIDVNLLMELETEKAVNVFQGKIFVPENTVIKSVSDSKGKIKEFSLEENLLSFETNYAVKKRKEVVGIEMQWNELIEEGFAPVYCPALQFSAIEGYEVGVTINAGKENRILSFRPSFGFESFYSEKKIKFTGEGPINTVFCYAKQGVGREFENFVLFNSEEDISKADELFYLIPLVLGIQPIYEKYPVLVLEDDVYGEKVNTFSEGINAPGRLSVIRQSLFESNEAIEVILHETTHSFNSWVLSWNKSKAASFDEGIAKTIEHLVRKKLGKRNPNLFYKNIVYVEGPKKITLYPVSNWEELLEYYKNNEDFVEEWNPAEGERNEFAYTYSELFLRNYLKKKGVKGLQEAYKKFLGVEETINKGKEFTEKIVELLEAEEKPCYYLTENELKTCLERVNGFSIKLPEKTNVTVLGNSLEGETLKERRIEAEKIKALERETLAETAKNFEEKMFKLIGRVFNLLGETIQGIEKAR